MLMPLPPYPLPVTIGGQPFHAQIISRKRELSWANGWTGEIKVKIPGAESAAFINQNIMTPFPGTQILRPQRITEEMLGEVLDLSATPDWVIQTWTYGLDFLDFPFPDDIPRPAYLAGTTLKLKVKYSGQFLCLPGKAFALTTPSSNPDGSPYTGAAPSLPPGSNARVLIPLLDYYLEWDRIPVLGSAVYLPASDGQSSSGFTAGSTSSGVSPGGGYLQFSIYEGAVNASAFLGCEPETLLFEGAEEEPSFMMTAEEPPAADPRCYKATVTLKRRRIVAGGQVYGWNHEYDCREKQWSYVSMNQPGADSSSGYGAGTNSVPRYPLVEFDNLFGGAASSSGN